MKFSSRENGFTILEVLVATMISTLTFMVLFCASFTIQDNINISSGILGITETSRFVVNRISNDIREAKVIRTSYIVRIIPEIPH